MNYAESKKQIDKIREEYGCKGDIIFRTAIQYIVDYGKCTLLDEGWYECTMNDIDGCHNQAEKDGKILFCTREFEKAIIDCAVALCDINTYDLLIYIQKEVWLSGDGISYQRAKKLLKYIIEWEVADTYETSYALEELREMGFDDDELEELGFDWMLEAEEEE